MSVSGITTPARRCARYCVAARKLKLRNLSTAASAAPRDFSSPPPPPPSPSRTSPKVVTATPVQTSTAHLTLQPQTLHSYLSSTPPSYAQLKYANKYFASTAAPALLFSTPQFRTLPASNLPEVCFLGRSNVGKSSLLNALFGREREKRAHVSKRPGRTRTINGYGLNSDPTSSIPGPASTKRKDEGPREDAWKRLSRGSIVVVDMPGYGAASREEWGTEILKYLSRRRQLRRTFVLIDAEHGPKGSDLEILAHLRDHGISHQVVLSKVDKLLFPGPKAPGAEKMGRKLMELKELFEAIREKTRGEDGRLSVALGDILACSAEKGVKDLSGGGSGKMGIDAIRWSVLRACGLESDDLGQTKEFAQDFETYDDVEVESQSLRKRKEQEEKEEEYAW